MPPVTRRALLGAATAACLARPAFVSRPAWAQSRYLTILTGGTAGVYYPLGVALASIYGAAIPGVRASVQATKGSVENLLLLEAGKAELAFVVGDALAQGLAGDREAGFKGPVTRIRGIAALYPNVVHVVVRADAGVATLEGLRGRSVGVGAPRSGAELNSRAALAAAGLAYADLGRVEYLPYGDAVELMKNRQLDAAIITAGLGVASIQDLATALPITILPIPAEQARRIPAPYVPGTIPADTYPGQRTAVPTAFVPNFLVTHAGVDDDLAQAMAQGLWEHLPELRAAHAAAAGIDPKAALTGLPVPLHPGARRWYDKARPV